MLGQQPLPLEQTGGLAVHDVAAVEGLRARVCGHFYARLGAPERRVGQLLYGLRYGNALYELGGLLVIFVVHGALGRGLDVAALVAVAGLVLLVEAVQGVVNYLRWFGVFVVNVDVGEVRGFRVDVVSGRWTPGRRAPGAHELADVVPPGDHRCVVVVLK